MYPDPEMSATGPAYARSCGTSSQGEGMANYHAGRRCERCGKRFKPARHGGYHQRFCSARCRQLMHRADPVYRRTLTRQRFESLLRRSYGITVETYAWMLYAQDFRCPLCGKSLVVDGGLSHKSQAHLDHNHRTGEIRGILCSYCNYRFLGPLERGGIYRVANAIKYLNEHGWFGCDAVLLFFGEPKEEARRPRKARRQQRRTKRVAAR